MQQDCILLDKIRQEIAPDGFDIIIDDASHIAKFTSISFWHLFLNHLKSGGIYIIEDWGTGYWASWPDDEQSEFDLAENVILPITLFCDTSFEKKEYESHLYGMVGFVKALFV